MKLCGNTALLCIANLLCLYIIFHRAFLSVKALRMLSCGLLLTGRNTSSPKCHVVHLCTVFLQPFNSICESFACWASALGVCQVEVSGRQGEGRRARICDKRCPAGSCGAKGVWVLWSTALSAVIPWVWHQGRCQRVSPIKWKGTVDWWIPNSVLPPQELFREVAHFPRKGWVTSLPE